MINILAIYSFTSVTSNLQGHQLISADHSIQVVYLDGVHQMAEQIIPLYEQYGCDCVKHLRGAISFCLYDSNKQLLLVSRDRIGEKQLYYAQLPTGIVFGNSLFRAYGTSASCQQQHNCQQYCNYFFHIQHPFV